MTNTNYPSATPQSQPPKNNTTKNILIGVLVVGLLGTWAYFLLDKNKSNEKIAQTEVQSASFMTQRDSLKMLYDDAEMRLDSITGANNNLQGDKSNLQKEIEAKKAEIRSILNKKNASDAELKRAKTLISELNEKISGLEAEVTRLTGENQELTASNTMLTQEKSDLTQNLESTKTEKEELEKTVDVASTF
ncbi:MAG TPA: hypothetical protein VF476_12745, partial [Chitinophagaceae bacterium]